MLYHTVIKILPPNFTGLYILKYKYDVPPAVYMAGAHAGLLKIFTSSEKKIYIRVMKYASHTLKSFILDFHLTNPAGADCFTASINFIVGGNNIKISSEVHIVTSYPGKSGVIYLLSKDIRMSELPTMFEAGRENFEYVLHKNLRIEGVHHHAGKYVVFIIPEKNIIAY